MGLEDELGSSGSGAAGAPRSKVWIYYLILALLSFIAVCTGQFIGLLGMLLFGSYSAYIYLGGRVVFWIW